jgi:hypothetical protein
MRKDAIQAGSLILLTAGLAACGGSSGSGTSAASGSAKLPTYHPAAVISHTAHHVQLKSSGSVTQITLSTGSTWTRADGR